MWNKDIWQKIILHSVALTPHCGSICIPAKLQYIFPRAASICIVTWEVCMRRYVSHHIAVKGQLKWMFAYYDIPRDKYDYHWIVTRYRCVMQMITCMTHVTYLLNVIDAFSSVDWCLSELMAVPFHCLIESLFGSHVVDEDVWPGNIFISVIAWKRNPSQNKSKFKEMEQISFYIIIESFFQFIQIKSSAVYWKRKHAAIATLPLR